MVTAVRARNGNGKSPEQYDAEQIGNGGEFAINLTIPYVATVTIEGVASFLYHRWSCEAVAEKAAAAKGSAAKKTDDVESYVYRTENGELGIPGKYLIGSIIDKKNGAAKYLQDPRSPRKSALDLYKAGVVALTEIASVGKDTWDYIDQQRVVIQQSSITRMRPALTKGWRATFEIQVLTPEYISPSTLHSVLINAGRLVGLGDYRPTYGRFQVVQFDHDYGI